MVTLEETVLQFVSKEDLHYCIEKHGELFIRLRVKMHNTLTTGAANIRRAAILIASGITSTSDGERCARLGLRVRLNPLSDDSRSHVDITCPGRALDRSSGEAERR